MANPFVNPTTGMNMGNIQQMYKMLTESKNPQALFMNIAKQNPQLRPIAQALSQGNSPQNIFTQMCNQRGINPDEFIKQITGNNTNSR